MLYMIVWILAQAATDPASGGSGLFTKATAGVRSFNVDFAQFGEALLSTAVLIMAVIIATQAGGQGIQRPVRQLALILGVTAFFLKGYLTITTGTLALF
jgi:hypothetical protein